MPGVLPIPIDLYVIQFETNSLKMIDENKVKLFNNFNESMKAVRLAKILIIFLIYDEREEFSISTQDSLNLLRNFYCVDFAYINDYIFRKTIFHSYLNSLKINNDSLINKLEIKNSTDSVNSNLNRNYTNDNFTGYDDMERINFQIKK